MSHSDEFMNGWQATTTIPAAKQQKEGGSGTSHPRPRPQSSKNRARPSSSGGGPAAARDPPSGPLSGSIRPSSATMAGGLAGHGLQVLAAGDLVKPGHGGGGGGGGGIGGGGRRPASSSGHHAQAPNPLSVIFPDNPALQYDGEAGGGSDATAHNNSKRDGAVFEVKGTSATAAAPSSGAGGFSVSRTASCSSAANPNHIHPRKHPAVVTPLPVSPLRLQANPSPHNSLYISGTGSGASGSNSAGGGSLKGAPASTAGQQRRRAPFNAHEFVRSASAAAGAAGEGGGGAARPLSGTRIARASSSSSAAASNVARPTSAAWPASQGERPPSRSPHRGERPHSPVSNAAGHDAHGAWDPPRPRGVALASPGSRPHSPLAQQRGAGEVRRTTSLGQTEGGLVGRTASLESSASIRPTLSDGGGGRAPEGGGKPHPLSAAYSGGGGGGLGVAGSFLTASDIGPAPPSREVNADAALAAVEAEWEDKGNGFLRPVGRKDAQLTDEWMQHEWARMCAEADPDAPALDMVEEGQHVLRAGMREIVRQTHVQCSDRGRALERVWKRQEWLASMSLQVGRKLRRKVDTFSDDFDGITTRERLEEEIQSRVAGLLSAQKEEYRGLLREAATREEELSVKLMHAEGIVERVLNKYERSKRACRDLASKTCVMRDLLQDAHDGFMAFLRGGEMQEFASSWSKRPEKELERQRAFESGKREDPKQLAESVSVDVLCRWEQMHDNIFELLLKREVEALASESKIATLENEIEHIASGADTTLDQLARIQTIKAVAIKERRMVSLGCQCMLLLPNTPGAVEFGDDRERPDLPTVHSKPHVESEGPPDEAPTEDEDEGGDIRIRLVKKSTAPFGIKSQFPGSHQGLLMPLVKLLETVDDFYRAKIEADEVDDKDQNERSSPVEFFYDYLLAKHGIKSEADKMAKELIHAVEYWSKGVAWVKIFGRFLGICKPREFLGESPHTHIGRALNVINPFLDAFKIFRRSKVGKRVSERDANGVTVMSRKRLKEEAARCLAGYGDWEPARECLLQLTLEPDDEFFTPELCIANLPDDKQTRNARDGDNSMDIDFDQVMLKIILLAISAEEHMFKGLLGKFTEADTDGDGVLTLQEFQAFVKLMDKTVKAKAVKTMYRAMLTESEGMGDRDSIHPYVFARTAMKHDLTTLELKHTYQTVAQQKAATLQRRDSQSDSLKRMDREGKGKRNSLEARSLGVRRGSGSGAALRTSLAAPPEAGSRQSSDGSAGSDRILAERRSSVESLGSVFEGRRMSVESLEGFSVVGSESPTAASDDEGGALGSVAE